HGAFNLKGSWGVTNEFLKKLNIYSADSVEQSFYVIELRESDLHENTDDNYQKKVDLVDIVESGRRLQNMIRPIQDACFYRAVTPVVAIDNDSFSDLIEINEEECPEKEQVVLLFDNKLYGPFEVSKKYSDKKCIRPEAVLKNYLLSYCDASRCKRLEFDIQLYGQNPIPVNFYKFVPDGSKQDVIPDSVLLEKLKDNIRFELVLEKPEEFVRLCSNSPFLGKLPEEVRKNRIARVKELITKVAIYREDIVSLTEELLNQIGQQLPEHLIESSEIYQRQAEKLRLLYESREDLQANLEILTTELKKYETSSQVTSTASNEEIEALKAELEMLKKEKALYADVEKLKAQKEELRVQNKYLSEEQFQLREESKRLKKEVQDAIANGFEHRADKAFDSYISHAMLEAAAQWEKTDESEKLKDFITRIADQSCSELSGENLISELVTRVQAKRNYTPNAILNIYINVVQNFITVFSGEPGVGKTSICDIIADSLGMNSFETSKQDSCLNRYIPVSVERGWQSKRDFIGYFNPLTRKYDRSNSKVYDALRILDTERENSKYPLFILLDEANLSPLEYYWADFMRLADESEFHNRFINIGTESDIFIPETLRFLATINTDQTTEQLSPRFIDRACIIKLPNVTSITRKEIHTSSNSKNFSPILWKHLVEIFHTPKDDKSSPLLTVRERIYELFNQHNICVSPRIELHIDRYIQVAQGIMESENGVRNHEKALDYAVLQKLLPKINGNYELYRSLFEKLKTISTENHLFMTLQAIETMEKFQEENMGYCQYLI
ncbi:MAG: AAA family ATPase, partial [Oscillospiraceae bacterium]|nr:AAA family ATPase [Oscillospiraceae bacterium]